MKKDINMSKEELDEFFNEKPYPSLITETEDVREERADSFEKRELNGKGKKSKLSYKASFLEKTLGFSYNYCVRMDEDTMQEVRKLSSVSGLNMTNLINNIVKGHFRDYQKEIKEVYEEFKKTL